MRRFVGSPRILTKVGSTGISGAISWAYMVDRCCFSRLRAWGEGGSGGGEGQVYSVRASLSHGRSWWLEDLVVSYGVMRHFSPCKWITLESRAENVVSKSISAARAVQGVECSTLLKRRESAAAGSGLLGSATYSAPPACSYGG